MRTTRIGCVARIVSHAAALLIGGLALASTTTYQYDELGRLKSLTSSDGTVVVYAYDAAGNRRTVTTTAPTPGSLRFSASSYAGGEASGQRSVTITVRCGDC